jgi:hypothetical protein
MSQEKNSDDNFKRTYKFLKEKYITGESFSKEDFESSVNDQNFSTYFGKKYKPILDEDPNSNEKFYVSERFKKISTWNKFRKHCSQVVKMKPNWKQACYENVLIYEFFLPLNNESTLRSALDDLFYRDTILKRIKRIERNELHDIFPDKRGESSKEYFDRLISWISDKFGGYSIGLVNGRFKSKELKTFKEVSELLHEGKSYLIDETTAIVRFIFSVGDPLRAQILIDDFVYKSNDDQDLREETKLIDYFFKKLFVRGVLDAVNEEDEIWMLQSDLNSKKLFIWRNQEEYS